MDIAIMVADLLLLISLFLRNWELMSRISELEERIDEMKRKESD